MISTIVQRAAFAAGIQLKDSYWDSVSLESPFEDMRGAGEFEAEDYV